MSGSVDNWMDRWIIGGLVIFALVAIMVVADSKGQVITGAYVVTDKEHEIVTDDGSTSHNYFFVMRDGQGKEDRYGVDHENYQKFRVGAYLNVKAKQGNLSGKISITEISACAEKP